MIRLKNRNLFFIIVCHFICVYKYSIQCLPIFQEMFPLMNKGLSYPVLVDKRKFQCSGC